MNESLGRTEGNPPCVLFEDDHLLVVDKPAGLNTHAPSPYAGEGLHEWLKNREPRWASLAIVHRLDKGTSGVMVFAKTPEANRSLTAQFTAHQVRKTYLFLTDRPVPKVSRRVRSCILRTGSKYRSFPEDYNDTLAETVFEVPIGAKAPSGRTLVQAQPRTGRTHQIRVHAADQGFPILGDSLYGGGKHGRLCLHAARLELQHPATNQDLSFASPPNFDEDPAAALRGALIDPTTNAWRAIHGASDGWPGWYVDRLGEHWLSQSAKNLTPTQEGHLRSLGRSRLAAPALAASGGASIHHKMLLAQVRETAPEDASPHCRWGQAPDTSFVVRENGIRYELSFQEGYSVGLFLDQRENRRRLLSNYAAANWHVFPRRPRECSVLNAFAYTCAFSVCAARAGASTTSLDLSRKYLDWGRRNFSLNGLNPEAHDFIYGDVFNWLPRLARKGRHFDVVLLDPPTFSKSKQSGFFRADKDYGKLIHQVLPMLLPGGTLFASCNTAKLEPETFVVMCRRAVTAAGRKVAQLHYAPQPPDFPVSREEPAYLKTVWMKIQ